MGESPRGVETPTHISKLHLTKFTQRTNNLTSDLIRDIELC